MNTSTLSPVESAATVPPPIDLSPRRLTEDVFQTAEEAVLADGQALPPVAAAEAEHHGSHTAFSLTRAVRTQVAERPCQSALLAAAVGALAAVVLRSQLRGRLAPLRPSWLRSSAAKTRYAPR